MSSNPVPEPKLVETITFKWPDDYDEEGNPFLPTAKQIGFSANITTPGDEQLVVTPEDMGRPIVLTRPFSLTKTPRRKGCYLNTITSESGEVFEDDTKTRAYCYGRQPSNGRYFYVSVYVNKFFEQSTSHLVIELAINGPSVCISAKDVTP